MKNKINVIYQDALYRMRCFYESQVGIKGSTISLDESPFGEINIFPGSLRERASRVTYRYIVVAAECNYIVRADMTNAPRINTSFYGVELDRRRETDGPC